MNVEIAALLLKYPQQLIINYLPDFHIFPKGQVRKWVQRKLNSQVENSRSNSLKTCMLEEMVVSSTFLLTYSQQPSQ